MKGLMSSKLASEAVQPEVLRSYEKEREQDALAVANAVSSLARLETDIDDLRAKEPNVDLTIQKLGMDIGVLTQRIKDGEKRFRDLQ